MMQTPLQSVRHTSGDMLACFYNNHDLVKRGMSGFCLVQQSKIKGRTIAGYDNLLRS